jgi:small subunit ribosomal protein S12e
MSDDQQKQIQKFVISALHQGVLAKGLHETCKAVDTKAAKFVVLAEDCNEDSYKKVIKALCKENNIPLVTVKEGNLLGEWIGICKYDNQQNVRKARRCSCLALRDMPADVSEEEAKAFLTSF